MLALLFEERRRTYTSRTEEDKFTIYQEDYGGHNEIISRITKFYHQQSAFAIACNRFQPLKRGKREAQRGKRRNKERNIPF
jgi:hypothetical protein